MYPKYKPLSPLYLNLKSDPMKKRYCYTLFFLVFSFLTHAQDPIVLFPGDTNNDGFCNYLDILPVGILYGRAFTPRDIMTLEWVPSEGATWPEFLPVSRVNAGFADCNGDGFIDEADVLALALNYDSSQTQSFPPPTPWEPKLLDTAFSLPPVTFSFSFDKDTAYIGDTLLCYFTHNVPDIHPTGAMGVAWWIMYDADLVVEEAVRVFPDTQRLDLMYLATTSLGTRTWRMIPPGNIQFGAAGKGMNVLQGFDTLCAIRFIIEDKILALENPFTFDCEAFICLDKDERVLPVIVEKDTTLILGKFSSTEEQLVEEGHISLFPNPVENLLQIEANFPADRIRIFNSKGQLIFKKEILLQSSFQIDTDEFLPGTYQVLLENSGKTTATSFVKK